MAISDYNSTANLNITLGGVQIDNGLIPWETAFHIRQLMADINVPVFDQIVSISSSAPTLRLTDTDNDFGVDIKADASTAIIDFDYDSGVGAGSLSIRYQGSEVVSVSSAGLVTAKDLDVKDTGSVTPAFESTDNNSAHLNLKTNSTNRRVVARNASNTVMSQAGFEDAKVKLGGASISTNLYATADATGITSEAALILVDGMTAPGTVSGYASIYVDSADGDLKIKFGDGTVKTIVVDT